MLLSRMTMNRMLAIMTLSKISFLLMMQSIITLSITTLSIMTLSIMRLKVITKNYSQQSVTLENGARHNATHHNDKQHNCRKCSADGNSYVPYDDECRSTECRFTDCRCVRTQPFGSQENDENVDELLSSTPTLERHKNHTSLFVNSQNVIRKNLSKNLTYLGCKIKIPPTLKRVSKVLIRLSILKTFQEKTYE